jgi:nicotinate-nucleotide adenylyltransferase
MSSAELRLEMSEAAAREDARFVVTDLEVRRAGPSFTVDTLRAMRDRHSEAELFLIVGADQLRLFDADWKAPEEILRLATLVVMDRDGRDAVAAAPEIPGMERLVHVPVTRIDLSSSEVRRRAAEGRDLAGLVPGKVEAIIRREGLYRGRG